MNVCMTHPRCFIENRCNRPGNCHLLVAVGNEEKHIEEARERLHNIPDEPSAVSKPIAGVEFPYV